MNQEPRSVSILIPVFNEVAFLTQVLERVEAVDFCGLDREILLVDDGSSDGSTELLRELEGKPGYTVRFHPQNRGKGASLRTAIETANGDILIIQDADLEYDPADYPPLLAPVIAGEADVVYGSRLAGPVEKGAFGFSHYWGNKFLTGVTNLLFGASLTDMETCYKVFRAPVLKGVTIRSDRFDFEPEITAKVLKAGHRIVELPIRYQGRNHDEGKKITWRDGFAAIKALIKFRLTD